MYGQLSGIDLNSVVITDIIETTRVIIEGFKSSGNECLSLDSLASKTSTILTETLVGCHTTHFRSETPSGDHDHRETPPQHHQHHPSTDAALAALAQSPSAHLLA